jgi:uncharacterized protein
MSSQTPAEQPEKIIRSFHVVTKPIGSACNLNCTYCYYLHKQDLLHDENAGRMDDGLLEEFIRQYIEGQDVDSILFNWHGGEPALLGLDFYRKVLEIERKYAGTKQINNDFQTNGVLLDETWCEFFKENGFYVGLSIDGPKHLHDQFRLTRGGEPTFEQVYRAARLLQKHDVPFNPLTVVNAVNARHPDEVYRFFTEDLGCKRLQWLPCVEPKDFRAAAPGWGNTDHMPILGTEAAKPGHPDSIVTDWSIDPDDWGNFLCQTFDLWMKHGKGKVFVNWFETLAGLWMGQPAQICTLAGVCGRSLVTIEKDGSIYSCERFVYPEFKLGNLNDKDCRLADLVYSPRQREFGCRKHTSLPDYCKQCKYLFACHGECPKNRLIKTLDGQPGLNYLCSGNRKFFAYADPYFRQIAAKANPFISTYTT